MWPRPKVRDAVTGRSEVLPSRGMRSVTGSARLCSGVDAVPTSGARSACWRADAPVSQRTGRGPAMASSRARGAIANRGRMGMGDNVGGRANAAGLCVSTRGCAWATADQTSVGSLFARSHPRHKGHPPDGGWDPRGDCWSLSVVCRRGASVLSLTRWVPLHSVRRVGARLAVGMRAVVARGQGRAAAATAAATLATARCRCRGHARRAGAAVGTPVGRVGAPFAWPPAAHQVSQGQQADGQRDPGLPRLPTVRHVHLTAPRPSPCDRPRKTRHRPARTGSPASAGACASRWSRA